MQNILGTLYRISRDSRVSEHLDTKSIVDSAASLKHHTAILEKWRSPGRSHNRHTTDWIPDSDCKQRDPVSLGEVEGAFHPSVSLLT